MFDHVEYFQGQMKYIIISQTKNISCAVGIVDAEINVPLLRTHSYRRFSLWSRSEKPRGSSVMGFPIAYLDNEEPG